MNVLFGRRFWEAERARPLDVQSNLFHFQFLWIESPLCSSFLTKAYRIGEET